MKNVGLCKMDGDVRVRVSRHIVLEDESGGVGLQGVVVLEDGGRNCTRRRGRESMLPAFDARVFQKMFARVLLRQDAGSGLVKPFVPAGVIEVPVRIYQLLDGVRINARQCGRNVCTRADDFRVNEQLSVGAGKNGDISTGAEENADIAAKGLNRDLAVAASLNACWTRASSWAKRPFGTRQAAA